VHGAVSGTAGRLAAAAVIVAGASGGALANSAHPSCPSNGFNVLLGQQASSGVVDSLKANWLVWLHILWSLISVFFVVRLRLWNVGGGRRGVPRGGGKEEYPGYIWIACALLVWFSGGIGAGLALSLSGVSFGLRFGSIKAQAIQSVVAFGVSILVAGVLLRLLLGGEKQKNAMGLHAAGALSGVWGFVVIWPLVWCAGAAAAAVFMLLTGRWPDRIAHQTLSLLASDPRNPWALVLGASAVFIAPLLEEIIYRGMLQTGLKRLFMGSAWPAIVGSSVIFALAHRLGDYPMPWNAVVTVGVLGLAMGILYERTRSLLAPVVVHCLFNATNIALALNM
jgi:membrane protease YdiL (CAAX protease family)